MPEISLDGTGGINVGDPLLLSQSPPLPYFGDGIPSCGMPVRQDVNENLDRTAALEDSDDARERREVAGLKQDQKDVFSALPTIGFTNPYKGKSKKTQAKPDIATTASPIPGTITDPNQNLPDGMPLNDQDKLVSNWMLSDFSPETANPITKETIEALDQDHYTYTGADLRVVVEVAGGKGGYKQLVELSTITVSIHRGTVPVRACGYINPKAFKKSTRTIAGTVILTQFWMDSLLRFLATTPEKEFSDEYWAKDLSYSKIDQIPPLNFTFYFADEHGHASVRRLLGVTLVTDGTVYSVNDQLTEQTISYMASDFTPLQPINTMGALRQTPATTGERTPKNVHAETFLNYKGANQPNVALKLPSGPSKVYPPTKPKSPGLNLLPGVLQKIFTKGN